MENPKIKGNLHQIFEFFSHKHSCLSNKLLKWLEIIFNEHDFLFRLELRDSLTRSIPMLIFSITLFEIFLENV
jgi:hypothetical protein